MWVPLLKAATAPKESPQAAHKEVIVLSPINVFAHLKTRTAKQVYELKELITNRFLTDLTSVPRRGSSPQFLSGTPLKDPLSPNWGDLMPPLNDARTRWGNRVSAGAGEGCWGRGIRKGSTCLMSEAQLMKNSFPCTGHCRDAQHSARTLAVSTSYCCWVCSHPSYYRVKSGMLGGDQRIWPQIHMLSYLHLHKLLFKFCLITCLHSVIRLFSKL